MTREDDRLVIVGRGPSVEAFDWPSGIDTMAVSSGIYCFPESTWPTHFCTMDEPKCFMDQLIEHDTAWANDADRIHFWPFWAEHRIIKHVAAGHFRICAYRPFPFDDAFSEKNRPNFRKIMEGYADNQHEFGFQPGWADFPNVFSWMTDDEAAINFDEDESVYPGFSDFRNSLLFAIQIAYRMGYRRFLFAGVDLQGEHYKALYAAMRACADAASQRGCEWFCSSEESRLSEFCPVVTGLVNVPEGAAC